MADFQLPHEIVNVHGGACALGHPIGASGRAHRGHAAGRAAQARPEARRGGAVHRRRRGHRAGARDVLMLRAHAGRTHLGCVRRRHAGAQRHAGRGPAAHRVAHAAAAARVPAWPRRWASTPAAWCMRWPRPSGWRRCWRCRRGLHGRQVGRRGLPAVAGLGMARTAWRAGRASAGLDIGRRPSQCLAGLPHRAADQRAESQGGALLPGLPAAVHRAGFARQDLGLPAAGCRVRGAEPAVPAGRGGRRRPAASPAVVAHGGALAARLRGALLFAALALRLAATRQPVA
jgi:hypothetical protein